MGLGRGRQVVSTAKTADLILVVMDITKATDQRKQMEAELEAVGIRLNTRPPDVVVKQKAAGGVSTHLRLADPALIPCDTDHCEAQTHICLVGTLTP